MFFVQNASQTTLETASPKNSARAHLNALTGIRAIAAIWVVLFHFRGDFATLLPLSTVLYPLVDKGFYAVDLFFALSGFILAYTYFGRQWKSFADYRQFLAHRLARIYPVHLFTLLVLLVLLIPAGIKHEPITTSRYNLRGFMENLLLIQSWGFKDWESWNQPSWSLSAEWFAYTLIFPLAYFSLRRVAKLPLALICTTLPIALFSLWNSTAPDNMFRLLVRVGLVFFSGCGLYLIYQQRKLSTGTSEGIAVTGSVAAIVLLCSVRDPWLTPLFFACVLLIILGLGRSRGPLAAVLSSKPLVYAGEASFSLYMTHGVVQKIIKILLPSERFSGSPLSLRLVILAAYLALITGAAIASYEIVEKPMRKRWRALSDHKPESTSIGTPLRSVS